MKINIGEYIKFYYAKGISLAEIGISYKAFAREDALEAVEMLRRFRIPILGGDVITLKKGRLDMSDDHWVCDLQSDFGDYEEYLEASWKKAEKYIRLFSDSPDCKYLYDLSLPFHIEEPPDDD